MRTFVLSTVLALCGAATQVQAQLYSRTGEFPPIQISYEELVQILDQTIGFVAHANQDSSFLATAAAHSLRIKGDGFSVSKDSNIYHMATTPFPRAGYSLTYTFQTLHGAIRTVTMDFSDYARVLTVEGTDAADVEALYTLMHAQLSAHTSSFAGDTFRSTAFLVVIAVLTLLGLIFAIATGASFKFSAWYSILTLTLQFGFVVSAFVVPYSTLFPGFAVYSGEVSFIRRYSSEISLVLAILPISASIIRFVFGGRKSAEKKRGNASS